MKRLRLYFLRRRSDRARAAWIAAGEPLAGPEHDAMLAAFVREGLVRYAKALEQLGDA